MKNITPQKSNSLTIDICKFLGAYMVVAIHTTPWNLFGTGAFNTVYLNFIYCAVPCFFMASGICSPGVWNGRLRQRIIFRRSPMRFSKCSSSICFGRSLICPLRYSITGARVSAFVKRR